jgi:hypothetical protein
MTSYVTNATGWTELMDGEMISAVYTMFDTAFGDMGLIVIMLFVVYQTMLYVKTQNLTLLWVIGVMFTSLYATTRFVNSTAVPILFFILVFELAGIFYLSFFSNR